MSINNSDSTVPSTGNNEFDSEIWETGQVLMYEDEEVPVVLGIITQDRIITCQRKNPESIANECLKKIPTIKIVEIDDECVVCLETFKLEEEVKKLPCNHIYHIKCLEKWMQNSTTCPKCRLYTGPTNPLEVWNITESPINFTMPMNNLPNDETVP